MRWETSYKFRRLLEQDDKIVGSASADGSWWLTVPIAKPEELVEIGKKIAGAHWVGTSYQVEGSEVHLSGFARDESLVSDKKHLERAHLERAKRHLTWAVEDFLKDEEAVS